MEPSSLTSSHLSNIFSDSLRSYYVQSQGDVDIVFNRLVRDKKREEVVELVRAVLKNPQEWKGSEALKNRTITLKLGDRTICSFGTLELLGRCQHVADKVAKGEIDLSKISEINLGIPELDAATLTIIADCQKGARSLLSYSSEEILKVAIATKALGIADFDNDLRRYLTFIFSANRWTDQERAELRYSVAHLLQQWEVGAILGSSKLRELLEGPNLWSSLPEDLLFQVAEFLSPEEIKGMPNEVIVHQLNQGKIKLEDLFKTAEEAIAFAGKFGMKRIDLRNFKDITQQDIEQLPIRCPLVESLAIKPHLGRKMLDIQHMSGSFTHLKELRLEGYHNSTTDSTYQQLISHAPNLRILEFMYCEELSEQTIINIAESLPDLTQLSLNRTQNMTERGAQQLSRLTKLESLDLSWTALSDLGLQHIATSIKGLQRLKLDCCKNIHNHGIQAIAENLPNLTSLNLSWCKGITEQGCLLIPERLPKLTFLDLSDSEYGSTLNRVTDPVIERITERLPNLEVLRVNSCVELSNDSGRLIGERLIHLHHLSIYGCSRLTDDGVRPIVETLRALTHLYLTKIGIVNNKTLTVLAENLKNLKVLSVRNISCLSDIVLRHLLENLPKLSEIVIGDCPISPQASKEIGQKFPHVMFRAF